MDTKETLYEWDDVQVPGQRDFNGAVIMTRLAPSMVFIIGLYAVPAPALAADERVTTAEPVAVAVEPQDDLASPSRARGDVPAAESKATAQPAPAPLKRDPSDAPRLEGDERALALEIEPFGWRFRLFGR